MESDFLLLLPSVGGRQVRKLRVHLIDFPSHPASCVSVVCLEHGCRRLRNLFGIHLAAVV